MNHNRFLRDARLPRFRDCTWGGCGMCGAAGAHRLPLAHPDLRSAFERNLAVFAKTGQCIQPFGPAILCLRITATDTTLHTQDDNTYKIVAAGLEIAED